MKSNVGLRSVAKKKEGGKKQQKREQLSQKKSKEQTKKRESTEATEMGLCLEYVDFFFLRERESFEREFR